VAIIEHRWVEDVRQELAKQGADIVAEEISADVHRQLVEGGSVVYTTVSGAGGAAAMRVATAGEQMEAQAVVVTSEGVAVGELRPTEQSANGPGADGQAAAGQEASATEAATPTPPANASSSAAGAPQSAATGNPPGASS
jgi:hypothetical protein